MSPFTDATGQRLADECADGVLAARIAVGAETSSKIHNRPLLVPFDCSPPAGFSYFIPINQGYDLYPLSGKKYVCFGVNSSNSWPAGLLCFTPFFTVEAAVLSHPMIAIRQPTYHVRCSL